MSESTETKTRFLATLTLTPGSLAAYVVAVEQGNLKITGLVPGNHEVILVEDRGEFQTLVNGKRVYPKVTFSAYLRDLVDGAYATLVGVALQRGFYAAALSTLGANRPYTVNFLWSIDGSSQGDPSLHTALFEHLRIEDVSIDEADLDMVTISGTPYGNITMV